MGQILRPDGRPDEPNLPTLLKAVQRVSGYESVPSPSSSVLDVIYHAQ